MSVPHLTWEDWASDRITELEAEVERLRALAVEVYDACAGSFDCVGSHDSTDLEGRVGACRQG